MAFQPYLLTTARLGFRQYRPADCDALLAIFADPQAAMFYPHLNERTAAARWIDWNLKNYQDHGHGLWALELLQDGTFIGDAGITWQTVDDQRVLEIGWHVHAAHRGQGYATEAGLACRSFGFDQLGAQWLHSIVDARNTASIKVATRVHRLRRECQGKSGPMLLFYSAAEAQNRGILRLEI